jgi:putative aldouronate transport system substrate-binding protein
MKKTFLFVLCFVMMAFFAFAGGQGQQGSAAGAKPVISLMTFDSGDFPDPEGTLEDNRWTRWINEHSPVTVKMVPVNRQEAASVVDALFASGSAPDLVFEYGKAFMDRLYLNGVIQPVDELVEKYSTEYKAYLARHPEMLPYITAEDGRIYGISSVRSDWTMGLQCIIYRQDWLEKFGMQTPKTVDELLTFARRVRDEDPDGNGIKDTWGIGGRNIGYWRENIMSMFGAPSGNTYFDVVNGHYVDWTTTPGFRAYLEFVALLFREGLVDPEIITDSQAQRQTQFWTTGKIGAFFAQYGNLDYNQLKDLKANVPTLKVLPAVLPPASSAGQFYFFHESTITNAIYCMNKDSKNQEAIIKYLDWGMGPDGNTLRNGFEGVHYNIVDGFAMAIDPEKNKREVYSGPIILGEQYELKPEAILARSAKDPLSQELARLMYDWRTSVAKYPSLRYIPYEYTTDAIALYNASTRTQIDGIITNVWLGKVTIDEGLRQLEALRKANGYDTVAAEKDAWYQKNKAAFQKSPIITKEK